MAVAFDAASNGNTASGGTLSHTCTGSNRLLLAAFAFNNSGAVTISGVTYAGNAMTKLGDHSQSTWWLSVWAIVAPSTGANNIVPTFSGGFTPRAMGMSFTGADQTLPATNPPEAAGSSTAITVNATGVTGGMICDFVNFGDAFGSQTLTVGSGQTQRINQVNGTQIVGSSTSTTVGTEAMDWTASGGTSPLWITIATPISPVAAAAFNPQRKQLLGVG